MLNSPIYVSSWCGKLFCASFTLILAILTTNTYIPLLPFGGLYIFLYLIFVAVLTVWTTCVVIQKFLKRTKPLEYNHSELLKWVFPGEKPAAVVKKSDLEERISEFCGDVEKLYIEKWFKHITDDQTFSEESRLMIADVTRRFLQIVVLVDSKKLLHGVLLILLKHLKEFRRSRKRCEKNGCEIEQAYRYSHVGSKSAKSQEFFVHKLTETFLRQFISWELWNSLPCRTLVAVLSRKLVNYLLIYVSKPGFINHRFLKLLASEEIKNQLQLNKYSFVSVGSARKIAVKTTAQMTFTPRDSPAKTNEKRSPPPPLVTKREKPAEFESKMVVSQPVKIHEAKIANKTWRDSADLECVSLGQDLLADDKKLWQENAEISPGFTANLLTNTMKPIENVTASIFQQETVNNLVKPVSQATTNAMHKIGDLQDEAAGVMEGIFDFGMAGIRKGLRLTGLQEESKSKKSAIAASGKKLPKWPQIVQEDSKSDDNVWINPLTSPNFEGEILLEKSPMTDQKTIPQISTDSEHVDSPEPEYEEAADFATTIAKLRSLLQQKSSESSFTTPAVSPMPQDTPQEATVEATDGVMPSLYKFCAKTATGMFQNTINTLKTALPSNSNQQQIADDWTFVASDVSSNDTISRVKRLLAERREFCTVDTAYEAIDSLNIEEDNILEAPPPFDDDPDDFEQQIPLTKAVLDVFCELIVDTNSSLVQESVVKSLLILIGQKTEELLEKKADKVIKNVNGLVGKLPLSENQETLPLKFEKMLEICVDSFPCVVKQLLSEVTVTKALDLLLSSFQSQKINEDVFLQIFELIAQQIILANSQLTPAFSA